MDDREKKIRQLMKQAEAIFNGGFLPTSIWGDTKVLLSIIDALREEISKIKREVYNKE